MLAFSFQATLPLFLLRHIFCLLPHFSSYSSSYTLNRLSALFTTSTQFYDPNSAGASTHRASIILYSIGFQEKSKLKPKPNQIIHTTPIQPAIDTPRLELPSFSRLPSLPVVFLNSAAASTPHTTLSASSVLPLGSAARPFFSYFLIAKTSRSVHSSRTSRLAENELSRAFNRSTERDQAPAAYISSEIQQLLEY